MNDLTPSELVRLTDYFARELDQGEIQLVERWIAASPSRSRFVEDMLRSRLGSAEEVAIREVSIGPRVRALRDFLVRIRRDEQVQLGNSVNPSNSEPNTQSPLRRYASQNWRAMSGMFGVLALLIATGLYVMSGKSSSTTNSASHIWTYATGPGERATITLPDGSVILLNVASRIDIPVDYATESRTVTLDGTALFTVKPNQSAPFTVIARNTVTKVLGTTFMVRRYASDSMTLVAVRDGKVSTGSTVLTAGEAVFETGLRQSAVHPAKEGYFGFATDELILDDVSLPNAIKELNRWYNTDIRIGDSSLTHRRITGVFESGSLTDLASILKLTFDIRVVRDGRVLTLYRGIGK